MAAQRKSSQWSQPRRRVRRSSSKCACASTRRRSASTSSTAASCTTCCGNWRRRAKPRNGAAMTEHVKIATEDSVLRIRLARPDKKNALTNAMYVAVGEALARAESDPDVRVVLFEGEGDAFTAGNDIAEFAAVAAGTRSRSEMPTHIFLEALARGTKPYVAAVNGLAVGVGVTMLMHCDVSYVAEDARLSTPFVNLALVPDRKSVV